MNLRVLLLATLALLAACGDGADERAQRRQVDQGNADYAGLQQTCAAGTRTGAAGITESVKSRKGVPLTVITPRNYDAHIAHPMLIVFAPAGIDRFEVERVTAFTAPATRAGFLLVFASHPPLGVESTRDLGSVPGVIAAQWCVDEKHVYFTGHSDGGTVSHMLSVMPESRGLPAAIAPSGAGVTREDLSVHGCRAPLPVMVTHSGEDKLFPGWGKGTAQWWAACNRCNVGLVKRVNGCDVYQGCDAHGPTLYCESTGGHAHWPGNAERIVAFFRESAVTSIEDRNPQDSLVRNNKLRDNKSQHNEIPDNTAGANDARR